MSAYIDPDKYEDWYHTPRGSWIAKREFKLLLDILKPKSGYSLLDIGCGTGYFSRCFAQQGLSVTGIDTETKALDFAQKQSQDIKYLLGNAMTLPFRDHAFDYTSAITSFCFIDSPAESLAEMWRVTRRSLVIGLLNRNSLLHHLKENRGAYQGARWDTSAEVSEMWVSLLHPEPQSVIYRSAVFFPQGNQLARVIERLTPASLLYGGFLAIELKKS